jgi:hypothetical protein
MRYQQGKFHRKRSVINGSLLLSPKKSVVPISRYIAAVCPKRHNWHAIDMRYKQDKFGRNRPVINGTILVRPKLIRHYLAYHCNGVTEKSNVPLATHALQAVEVWSKSMSNEGHYTRKSERFSRPYLASHCTGETKTSHLAIHPHAIQALQVWSKSVGNEGHYTLETEKVFRQCFPRIAVW